MALRVGRIILLLSVVVNLSFAVVDQSVYWANAKSKLYRANDFVLSTSYATKVGTRVAPIFILGIIFFFFFLFWSCGRCCNCCKPYRQSQVSPRTTTVISVLIILLSLGCVAMLIYGFTADAQQSKTFNQIPELVDNIIAWKNNAELQLNNFLIAVNVTRVHVGNVVTNNAICNNLDCSKASQIYNDTTTLTSNAQTIIDNIGSISLQSARDSVARGTSSANDYRHLVMVIILSVMFSVIICQSIISIANTYARPSCQPRKVAVCKPFTWTMTTVLLIFVFVMWFLAALLLAFSTVFADYCYNPIAGILNQASINSNVTLYYLKCGNYPNMNNPLTSNLGGLQTASTSSRDAFNVFNTTVLSNCSNVGSNPSLNTSCLQVLPQLPIIDTDVQNVFLAVGVVDANGNAQSGLLSLLSCSSINGLIQAVFHLTCDDLFVSLATTFEVFMAFAALMVLMEFFKRKNPVRDEDYETSGSQVFPTSTTMDEKPSEDGVFATKDF